MSCNIEGLLRNYKGKKITFMTDDNGKQLSDTEARAEIAKLQAKGHKLIPSADCEGFDPLGGGCPGHPEFPEEMMDKLTNLKAVKQQRTGEIE